MKRLPRADLPRVRAVGAEIAGTSATVELEQGKVDVQIASMERRLKEIQRRIDDLAAKPKLEENPNG